MNGRCRLFALGLGVSAIVTLGCDRTQAIEDLPEGADVMVETQDGQLVRGRLTQLEPDTVVVSDARTAARVQVSRPGITTVRSGEALASVPEPRMITIPARTSLDVTLDTTVASSTSQIEDPVRATLASPLVVDGFTVAPSGSLLTGIVTQATPSGKVKGRAEIGFRFDNLHVGAVTYDVNAPAHFTANATKARDAGKIGIGAAAGALIGAIAGGGKGAAVGSAVGAGGGTAVVLATEGEEIELHAGGQIQVALAEPLTVAAPGGSR